jgi:hypothetical protein
MLGRFQADEVLDLKVFNNSPIGKVIRYMGRLPIEMGYQSHVDS